MSWPLATFAIVLGILVAGWLAYERSRPSARMTAVVGTLAAVAALGRDAFVALPDVKPITAMTLVVGYALGPLPGFAVGAIGMLASNILLGQGPYTPWQMAAWGLVGLAGAALGQLSGRRLGRLGIALACGVSALAAKEVMNIYTWTLGASHTPAAFMTVAGAALPFDVTDALASFLFGLAFGPELARLLGRTRARMTVTWEAAATPLVLLVLLCAAIGMAGTTLSARAASFALPQSAGAPRAKPLLARSPAGTRLAAAPAAVSRGVAYLKAAQNADGGFGGAKGQRSSELYSAWVAMGLAAAGRDPLSLKRAGHSLLDSIRVEASTLEGPGDQERTILALHACGVSVRALPGGDLLAKLVHERASDGSFDRLVDTTTFAIFALRAAGRPVSDPIVRAAGRWLGRQQGSDGGFSFAMRGAQEDVDDTAAALQGVIDAGGGGSLIARRAVIYLRNAQNPDGGYPQRPGGASNAQSTAWAVQGLIAAGQNPRAVRRKGSRSPVAYIESLIDPDGSVRYSRTSAQTPVWVTAQALMALAGRPFPIAPVVVPAARHALVPHARIHPSGGLKSHAHASVHVWRSLSRRPAFKDKGASSGHAKAVKAAAQSRLDAVARTVGVLVSVVLAPVLR